MSKIVSAAPAPRGRIVARRFLGRFRYHVIPFEDRLFIALHTSCLKDARWTARQFTKAVSEIGPPAAFRRSARP